MKLANDFLIKCLNYEAISKKALDELGEIQNSYYQRNELGRKFKRMLFEVEEKDFNIAIELCKQFKRSMQKKAYEHHLERFKESGIYNYNGWETPSEFINDLRNELIGNRGYNHNKEMLIEEALKNRFPEMDEINAARKISQLVLDTTDIEYCFHCAEQELHRHQAKLNSLTEAAKAEKSLLEIVEHLEEQNEED